MLVDALLSYHYLRTWQRTIISMLCTQRVHWGKKTAWEEQRRTRESEIKKSERRKKRTHGVRLTNEPDSSLLFCSEEQSGRVSVCNYRHHLLRGSRRRIVLARFLRTTRGEKGLHILTASVLSLSILHTQYRAIEQRKLNWLTLRTDPLNQWSRDCFI